LLHCVIVPDEGLDKSNGGVLPYFVLACQADFQTQLDDGQFYTYVISEDPPHLHGFLGADLAALRSTEPPITVIVRVIPPDNSPIPTGPLSKRRDVR
jgi:hypothetical protein